ncbi:MAG: SpoIIE family protein phosphatase [Desulfobacterales bacterium]|jgi:sigma-B regulation protein RsbU (phosphoserine phosphatase)|nr:SpoIIE family protein phosphatase [Desulfobacterales bacterium]
MAMDLDDLRDSPDFLNLIFDNMGAALLIADEELQIHQFNRPFLNLFDNAADSPALKSFGEVSGCVNAVREHKACGLTSACGTCALRRSLIQTLVSDAPVDRKPLERVFYIHGHPVLKHLRFTTRRIAFRGRTMILVLIYDVSDIEQQKVELQRRQALIDRDLKAAAAIQESLLPSEAPCVEHLRSAWAFAPSERIGGDIFNIHRVDRSMVGAYMLDVCGHGVPAALVAVAASQFLQGVEGFGGGDCRIAGPAAVLNSLEAAFPFERFDTYFSVACLTLDVSDGLLAYACAGHPSPVVVRRNGVLETLEVRGAVIGADGGVAYEQRQLRLAPGDKVLLYTDGVLENRGPSGEAFGRERFGRTLRRAAGLPVEEFVPALHAEVRSFLGAARPDDDISILGIEYTGGDVEPYAI